MEKLVIPNLVMRNIYSDYFFKIISDELELKESINYMEILREIALEGKIDKIIGWLEKYLNNLSNRDFWDVP